METVTAEPRSSLGLDINPPVDPKDKRGHGKHGWFAKGPRSYAWLLEFQCVKDFIDAYTSKDTRHQRLYVLEKVLEAGKLSTPDDLLKLSDREAKLLVKRVSNLYTLQGKQSYARIIEIVVRLFFESSDRELKFRRSEKARSPRRVKINIEHIPTKAEVFRMADVAGSLRNRALILGLYLSGVRPVCICNWRYGLVSQQFYPDIKAPVELKITPDIDPKLSLYGLSYYVSFLEEEGARALKDYIEERKKKEEWTPKQDDRIFVTASSASRGEPMGIDGLWTVVKFAAEKAGLDPKTVWPKLLRKSFRKTLNATESLDEDTKEALMGHRLPGSRGNYFDFHDIGEIRKKYLSVDWSREGTGQVRDLREELTTMRKSLEEKEAQLETISKGYQGFLSVAGEWETRIGRLEKVQNHPLGPGMIFHEVEGEGERPSGKAPFRLIPISGEEARFYGIDPKKLATDVDPKTRAPVPGQPKYLMLRSSNLAEREEAGSPEGRERTVSGLVGSHRSRGPSTR